MPPKTEPFKIIEVSPMKITINEDRIRITVSIEEAALAPLARYAERQLVFTPDEPVNERDDNVEKPGGQSTKEEIINAERECAFDRIVHRVNDCGNIWYLVHWCGYNSADATV